MILSLASLYHHLTAGWEKMTKDGEKWSKKLSEGSSNHRLVEFVDHLEDSCSHHFQKETRHGFCLKEWLPYLNFHGLTKC